MIKHHLKHPLLIPARIICNKGLRYLLYNNYLILVFYSPRQAVREPQNDAWGIQSQMWTITFIYT